MNFDQEMYMCEVCGGRVAVTTHEIFYGTADRKISKKYPFCQRKICSKCHDACHYKIDLGQDINKKLRIEAQIEFEKRHGKEKYMEVIGTNYLRGGE